MIMAEIGAHDHERFVTAPGVGEHGCDLLWRGRARYERQQRELRQDQLQEWQLHFETVLRGVRPVGFDDTATPQQLAPEREIERNRAERRQEVIRLGHGDAGERYAVTRADQHDSPQGATRLSQQRIRSGCHRARVDVAGMRDDQGLGRRGKIGRPGGSEERRHFATERVGVRRVKRSGYGRRTGTCILATPAHDSTVYARPASDGSYGIHQHALLACSRWWSRPVRRLSTRVPDARWPARALLRARRRGGRSQALHLWPVERILYRSDRE